MASPTVWLINSVRAWRFARAAVCVGVLEEEDEAVRIEANVEGEKRTVP